MYKLEKEKVTTEDFSAVEVEQGVEYLHCVNGDVEICLEPLTFGRANVAIYDNDENLLLPKVQVQLRDIDESNIMAIIGGVIENSQKTVEIANDLLRQVQEL